MSILINILLVIHVLISLFIILLVLMQRPKNEGLGAAFGGGMTDNLFGAQTTNVLQSLTRWLGGLFFALTLLLSFLYVKNSSAKSSVQKSLSKSAVPAATPAPVAATEPMIVNPATITKTVNPALEKKEGDATAVAPTAPGAGDKSDAPPKPADPKLEGGDKAPAPNPEPPKSEPPAAAPAEQKPAEQPAKK